MNKPITPIEVLIKEPIMKVLERQTSIRECNLYARTDEEGIIRLELIRGNNHVARYVIAESVARARIGYEEALVYEVRWMVEDMDKYEKELEG